MQQNKTYNEFLEKLNKGELSTEQQKTLVELLKSEKGRKKFYNECLFTSALQDILSEEAQPSERIHKISESQRVSSYKKTTYRSKSTMYASLSGVAALFLLGLFFFFKTYNNNTPSIATIELAHNEIRIERGNIEFKAANAYLIKSGDVIKVNSGILKLRLNDGSLLHFDANSQFSIHYDNFSYNLHLETGKLFADIKPQINPLQITTHLSKTIVLGTRFNLEANNTLSQLHLIKGKVSFTRSSDLTQTILEAGEQISTIDMKKTRAFDSTKTINAKLLSWDITQGLLKAKSTKGEVLIFKTLSHDYKKDGIKLYANIFNVQNVVVGQNIQIHYRERGYRELVKVISIDTE